MRRGRREGEGREVEGREERQCWRDIIDKD